MQFHPTILVQSTDDRCLKHRVPSRWKNPSSPFILEQKCQAWNHVQCPSMSLKPLPFEVISQITPSWWVGKNVDVWSQSHRNTSPDSSMDPSTHPQTNYTPDTTTPYTKGTRGKLWYIGLELQIRHLTKLLENECGFLFWFVHGEAWKMRDYPCHEKSLALKKRIWQPCGLMWSLKEKSHPLGVVWCWLHAGSVRPPMPPTNQVYPHLLLRLILLALELDPFNENSIGLQHPQRPQAESIPNTTVLSLSGLVGALMFLQINGYRRTRTNEGGYLWEGCGGGK